MFLKKFTYIPVLINHFLLIQSKNTMSTINKEFPKTLAGFGYGFNSEGKLRKINPETKIPGDEPFEFNVSNDAAYNQRHYEAIGEILNDHVYDLLETEGLQKIHVPSDIPSEDATFVFATKQKIFKVKKLLILIHGSGVVRAGQWARSLIINQSLNHGTQIPYVRKAKELGYDVLVMNTNDNTRNGKVIVHNSSPIEHASYVFDKFIGKENSTEIEALAIVSHSYGGIVTMNLAEKYSEVFKTKLFALGFTDSVHSSSGSGDMKYHLSKIGRHWVTSSKPVNTPLSSERDGDIQRFSAGHVKHEWTSWACMDALFEFFEDKYNEFIENRPKDKKQKISDEL